MNSSLNNNHYICVSGYGWSGSGACIDLLKEFKGFVALEGEFRITKDPHGLRDLEESLVHRWDFVRHDIAIRDFLNYCEMLGSKTSLFSRAGKDFSNKLNIDFQYYSKLYIDRLTSMTYLGNTFVHRYNISSYNNFFLKIKSKLGLSNAKLMYFSRPTEDFFKKEAKIYIDSLFQQYKSDNNAVKIILDQAVSPTDILNTSKYFDKIKIIIIDRDPRDIYVNLIKRDKLLGPELVNATSAEKYIKWHSVMRRMSENDQNNYDFSKQVLRLNFEDLVLNYESSVSNIVKFLGDGATHNNKYKFFNPDKSIRNIGLWKKHYNQDIMKEITEKLPEYCIDL